ncbi:hypothetical protein BVRB_8g201250 [Beta vulgaris subsp. vulgaris]|uniref:Uncharacterized protein n=1 Tax=Beta vulgaris subsp. vulgaris TaxID=3555 RepID=A0A0J8B5W7_BETVV|nr:hypothetical protein BVRB_8g201250 [Beta vulgaris subsp. vulgaris]
MRASEENKEDEKQWGAWIRASPRRGRQKIEEETKAFLKGARALDFIGSAGEVEVSNKGGAEVVGGLHGGSVVEVEDKVQEAMSFSKHLEERERAADGEERASPKETTSASPIHVHGSPIHVHGETQGEAVHGPRISRGKSPNFTFVAGKGNVAKKYKKTKMKASSNKSVGEIEIDAHFEVVNEMDVGEKRKLVDNMLVDDEIDLNMCGRKKQKVTVTNIDGNESARRSCCRDPREPPHSRQPPSASVHRPNPPASPASNSTLTPPPVPPDFFCSPSLLSQFE